ncbi:MAG: hypothetical protein II480_11030 [Bacteroidales bacterium]|nr:hypothetical protein [Bacteroidales bacterium]
MKKILSLLTVLCLAFSACGNNDDDVVTPIEPQNIIQNVEQQTNTEIPMDKLLITINGKTLTADFADNSSAKALADALAKSSITYQADDYGNFEKVGDLGQPFPKNDENITTEPGDIILYQGHNLCIYYAQNTWSFTRIAKIKGISKDELKEFLGEGEITVTLSVEK